MERIRIWSSLIRAKVDDKFFQKEEILNIMKRGLLGEEVAKIVFLMKKTHDESF